ncbi:PREDICTED: probable lipid-A-disaccharide synthase, mitochondrial isoform X2 [Theobroma cacao]|uniref:lipid-A-disaccharide synthase n=1 Tax=Theobroma cacao TaxID=3641 RepID=A0AB32VPN6_THECC|nr:PREDICTED: probable lipid-A-disaccharide synthase, mitochondrial isoform X2 [Theobroma cacao]
MLLAAIRCTKIKSSICLKSPSRRYLWVSSRFVTDRAAKEEELRIFIVAGEVSGDTIGSRLMASLKKLSPVPIRFSGVGGSMMSKQGLKSLFPMDNIAVMGIWELLPHLYNFRVKLKETVEAAFMFHPHVVVTVDSKGFSFRLLKQLRGCQSKGLAATFVGHPILEDVLELNMGKEIALHEWKITGNGEDFRKTYAIPSGATVITLLPGSRLQEVTRMLPIFSNTMKLLKDSFPELVTVIHVAPNQLVDNFITRAIHKWPVPAILIPGGIPHLKYDAFNASRVALCTSGTVAMELQLARLPCLVTYRAHFLTEWVIRYKAKIPYISLPNILLDSPVIPEALFQACTPTKLASSLKELMNNTVLQQQQVVAAEKVMELICPSNRTVNNLQQQGMRWRPPIYTPSMIAASTILSYAQR